MVAAILGAAPTGAYASPDGDGVGGHDEPALVSVEARAGYGGSFGGGAGGSTMRLSPISFAAVAELAISDVPRAGVYAGVIGEGGDRGAVGGTVGLRLHPERAPVRVAAGFSALLVPYDLFGATVSAGHCFGAGGGMALCGDLEGTLFFAGSDLPDGRMAAQLQLVIGVAFDVY